VGTTANDALLLYLIRDLTSGYKQRGLGYVLSLAARITFSLTASFLLNRTDVSGLRNSLYMGMYLREQSANGRWWSCKNRISNVHDLYRGIRCRVQVLFVGVSSLEGAI
jgi:hypothetical protein